jgi:signal transduction histidine kinase
MLRGAMAPSAARRQRPDVLRWTRLPARGGRRRAVAGGAGAAVLVTGGLLLAALGTDRLDVPLGIGRGLGPTAALYLVAVDGPGRARLTDEPGVLHRGPARSPDGRTLAYTVARLLQARRELVAAVSHELRTPVATVRAYLDSALDRPPDAAGAPPPPLRHDLAIMARETERLQRLIEDLFVLSRAEAGRLPLTLGPVDAGALLTRCAAAAAPLAWERGRVEVLAQAPPTPVWVRADDGCLEQVVRNLVANAVRHTPPGGLVLLTAAPAGDGVIVQVKDTGEGIPAEDLPRIWERFYRGDAARERDAGVGAPEWRGGAARDALPPVRVVRRARATAAPSAEERVSSGDDVKSPPRAVPPDHLSSSASSIRSATATLSGSPCRRRPATAPRRSARVRF